VIGEKRKERKRTIVHLKEFMRPGDVLSLSNSEDKDNKGDSEFLDKEERKKKREEEQN
jgi:hypothetical protein